VRAEAAAFMLPRPATSRGPTRSAPRQRRPLTDATCAASWTTACRHRHAGGAPLSDQERDDVVAYIKTFSRFFEGAAPEPLAFAGAPGESAEGIEEGARVYRELECFKCHGDAGRGDGPSAPTLTDDWDHPIRAADLTRGWNFNGGAEVEQIFARLRTGLDGTPMPSFSDAIDGGVITEAASASPNTCGADATGRRSAVIRVVRGGRLPIQPPTRGLGRNRAGVHPARPDVTAAPSRGGRPGACGHDGTSLAIPTDRPSASPDSAQEW
jgi:mono/diheme cytochrome c family protein